MMTLPSIANQEAKQKQPPKAKPSPAVTVERTVKKEITVSTIQIPAQVMTGLNFGVPRRHVMIRLDRRQAAALRCLVEGWEQGNSESIAGRRANEQDWLRSILNDVADQLGM